MNPIVPLLSGNAHPAPRGSSAAQDADAAASPFNGLLTPLMAKAGKAGSHHALFPQPAGASFPDKEGLHTIADNLSRLSPEDEQAHLALLPDSGVTQDAALPFPARPFVSEEKLPHDPSAAKEDDEDASLSGLPTDLIALLASLRDMPPPVTVAAPGAENAAPERPDALVRHPAFAAPDKLIPVAPRSGDAPVTDTPDATAATPRAPAMATVADAAPVTPARTPATELPAAAPHAEQPVASSLQAPLQHAAPSQHAAEASAPPLLNARLGSPEWQQALSQQILLFNRNGQHQAELRLNPRELGAVQISLNVSDNQAQLHLVSAHSQVRAALESALPQLRTALAESGIQLGHSSVGGDAQPQWGQNDNGGRHAPAFAARDAAETGDAFTEQPIVVVNVSRHDGQVDIAV